MGQDWWRRELGETYLYWVYMYMYMYMYTTAKKKHPNQLGYLVGIWL